MDSLADLGAALPSSDGVSASEAVFGDDAMLRSILCCVPHDYRWAASRVCQHWLKLFRAGWHYWCKCGDEREAKLRWGGKPLLPSSEHVLSRRELAEWALSEGFWVFPSGNYYDAYPEEPSTLHAVAANGDVEMLKWVRAQGCPDEWGGAASAAAVGGHLEAVRFAVLHGCSMDGVIAEANSGNHVDVVRWATERGQGTGGSLPVDDDLDLD